LACLWSIAVHAPALRCCFALQSCLCPTPDLRSFHMGIALSTLTFSTLPAPLRAWTRWLQQVMRLETTTGSPHRSASATTACADSLRGHATPHRHETGGDAKASANVRPALPASHRPLRGNWPFNVRPPVTAADAPARQQTGATRSFLPASSPASRRDTFFAALATEGSSHRPARVFRRASDAGTGRLVIAGRMADVCAELDRMAASEGLRTQ
jgi:hypothetical protein